MSPGGFGDAGAPRCVFLIMRARTLATVLLTTASLALFLASSSPASDEPRTVARVDLDRYAGRWFEIARYPNRFQKQCAGDVVARYARRPDGDIDVVNTCRTSAGTVKEAKGLARLAERGGSQAKLQVRFAPAFLSWLPAVWGDYWILSLADDYSWAIVGDRARKYLWLLARTPSISDDLYRPLAQEAAARGFDPGTLVKTTNH